MSFLVVEADTEPAVSLNDRLSGFGYDCHSIPSIDAASELCEAGSVDLVTCDRLADAQELCVQQPLVPVVACIAKSATRDQLLASMQSGVADVLEIAVSDDEMRTRIRGVLARGKRIAAAQDQGLSRFQSAVERDQKAGRHVQVGMLPPNPMAIERYRLEHRVQPSLILSGDFVDYFRITDHHFAMYVADVSGHGASSAFVTVLLKNFSRRIRREYRKSMLLRPEEIVAWMNRELLEQEIDKHVALFFGIVDVTRDELRYVNAGHFPPAILIGDDGSSQTFEEFGKPVGLFSDAEYASYSVPMGLHSRLVVFSDGILEMMAGDDLAEREQRLKDAARTGHSVDEVWKALDFDASNPGPDDVSCLMLTREE